jgi:Flp pilus assembly protein TadG
MNENFTTRRRLSEQIFPMWKHAYKSKIRNGLRDWNLGWGSKALKLWSNEDGGPLLEFTVLMPVLVMILLGIIEFGSILYLKNNMTNAAREGARTSSVQGGSLAAANNTACRSLAGTRQTFTISSSCVSPQDANVQISVAASSASLLNVVPHFDNGRFTLTSWGGTVGAGVTMRSENTCAADATTCQCNTSADPPTGC